MDRFNMAITTAFVFFGFGTMLLILQLCCQNKFAITIFGFYYVLFSVIANSLVVLVLLFVLIFKMNKIKTLKSIGALLINIPIACVYFLIVTETYN
ncbi:MAG: hypothetical protein V7719_17025 [Psychroserpens sp.]|uniref:hypothetical protein n=1 Tax=Psychroserpens sp. TaxID=2020870 RepID=UPI003001B060